MKSIVKTKCAFILITIINLLQNNTMYPQVHIDQI